MIALVSRAEEAVVGSRTAPSAPPAAARPLVAVQSEAERGWTERLSQVAPVLRGLLAARTGDLTDRIDGWYSSRSPVQRCWPRCRLLGRAKRLSHPSDDRPPDPYEVAAVVG